MEAPKEAIINPAGRLPQPGVDSTNSDPTDLDRIFPAMDQYLPHVVLAEIAAKLPHIDFTRFRRVSRNCYYACESKTNPVEKFEFECTKLTDSTLKCKATIDEWRYFLSPSGEVIIPKCYGDDDPRDNELKIFPLQRGVRHFFNRLVNKRPQHVLFNITQKYIGQDICQLVYDEIALLAQKGLVVNLRKFTLYVDSVDRYRLLTSMFLAAEYEIHGCTANEMLIDDVGPNIRNCPLNLQIDQFSVDIRQLNAKHLYLWDVTLELEDFVEYLRNRTKLKSGLVMQFNIFHDKDLDLMKVIEVERKRLNPVGTPLLEYTVFLAKPKNSILQTNGLFLSTIQFRWHVINTKAPWLSSRQSQNV